MKIASDFRRIAREALRGRWGIAVIAGLLATLLGAGAGNGPEVTLNIRDSGAAIDLSFANQEVFSTAGGIAPELKSLIVGGTVYVVLAAIVMAAVFFVLGSVIEAGYARFNLKLVDREEQAELNTMFSYFPHWKTTALTNFMKMLRIIGWSLLLVIPGIIAAYSYAMTGYIMAEHPEMQYDEILANSKAMMNGNRWRLFCLQFSFIGWDLLAALTFGIGNLWLNPYKQAATAAFFREVSGTERRVYTAPEYL